MKYVNILNFNNLYINFINNKHDSSIWLDF